MSKFRLAQVQLATALQFNGASTASLLDSQAAVLEYDSEEELVRAQAKKPGAPLLLIPETNVLYMVEFVEPPQPKKPEPVAPNPVAPPKSDVIKAVAPGVTQRQK